MTIVLKKGQRLDNVLPKGPVEKPAKKLNSKKYVGVLNLTEDPLEIQRRMLDEWE